MDNVKLKVLHQYAASIPASSPIPYMHGAKLHGELFGHVADGSVSSVFTNFYVDHAEPLGKL
jgi:hypothetical protein